MGALADFLQEVLQGLVHGPAVLRGARQAIEVGQHFRSVGVELEIQLCRLLNLHRNKLSPNHTRNRL